MSKSSDEKTVLLLLRSTPTPTDPRVPFPSLLQVFRLPMLRKHIMSSTPTLYKHSRDAIPCYLIIDFKPGRIYRMLEIHRDTADLTRIAAVQKRLVHIVFLFRTPC